MSSTIFHAIFDIESQSKSFIFVREKFSLNETKCLRKVCLFSFSIYWSIYLSIYHAIYLYRFAYMATRGWSQFQQFAYQHAFHLHYTFLTHNSYTLRECAKRVYVWLLLIVVFSFQSAVIILSSQLHAQSLPESMPFLNGFDMQVLVILKYNFKVKIIAILPIRGLVTVRFVILTINVFTYVVGFACI